MKKSPSAVTIPSTPFPATEKYLGLYPVVDSVEWIERLLNAGVSTIQLRIKDKTDEEVRDDIQQAITLGKKHNARLFINDYWQLAVELGAYGVHLGQEDLETTDLLAIHQAGLRLGISTHDEHELTIAKSVRPSYIAMGHIFPTQTKEMPSSPQGLETLRQMVAATPDYPTVAIGGISIDRVPAVLATGVGSVALVSAITLADDWLAATQTLLDLVENKRLY
ncbi:thiamine phosphate synthase [Providencia alcalifaciens]|uniref:thiamine phosphate synthase n=2 Tax=Providencia TaxID=586 RepID=UPI0032DAE71D